MKKYKVIINDDAKDQLAKLDKEINRRIVAYLKNNLENCENPKSFGKGLVGNRKGEWRYRVGDYRILCNILEETIIIIVVEVGHRKNIY